MREILDGQNLMNCQMCKCRAQVLGFEAEVDATGLEPGLHWLGLRLTGRDGFVSEWSEQPIRVQP